MIKLEHKLLPDRGIVAFALECTSPGDTAVLDTLLEVINNPGKYTMSAGFSSTNRLVIQARGWTKEEFEAAEKSAKNEV